MSFNLATILTEATLAAPDAPACRFAGTTTTYRELDELSWPGRGRGCRKVGLRPSAKWWRMQLPNIPQFLIGYFGALKAGLVVLPLNPLLVAPELEYHLTDSAASLLIGFEGMHAEAAKACETTGVPLYLVSLGTEDPPPDGAHSVLELISSAPLDEPGGDVVARGPDDTAVLVYTSGTTGRPKGAELTHFQLYMNSTVAGGLFGVRSDDVVLAVLPFFHVFGLSSVVNVFVRAGGLPVSVLPRFQPGRGAGRPRDRPVHGDRRRADHAARRSARDGPSRRPRPVGAAGRGVRRRVARRRRHADVRGEVRHRGARGLRDDRDRELKLVQPAGRPEGAVHRQAEMWGSADAAFADRPGTASRCRYRSVSMSARSSSAGTT